LRLPLPHPVGILNCPIVHIMFVYMTVVFEIALVGKHNVLESFYFRLFAPQPSDRMLNDFQNRHHEALGEVLCDDDIDDDDDVMMIFTIF
jgi:hypothetical protein